MSRLVFIFLTLPQTFSSNSPRILLQNVSSVTWYEYLDEIDPSSLTLQTVEPTIELSEVSPGLIYHIAS